MTFFFSFKLTFATLKILKCQTQHAAILGFFLLKKF